MEVQPREPILLVELLDGDVQLPNLVVSVLEIWRRFPLRQIWSIFRHLERAVLWWQHQGGDGDRAGGPVLVLLAVLCHHPLEVFILISNGVCLLPIPNIVNPTNNYNL